MGLYDPILTSVGLLKDGKLTKSASDKYWDEVTTLLIRGNANGKGMPNVITAVFPIPPTDPTPPIANVTTLEREKVFWFDPDPAAAAMAAHIKVRKNAELLHTIFLDILFEKTAQLMDLNGQTPLAPIFDVSAALPDIKLPLPYTPPDLALALKITLPELPAFLLKLGIKIPPDLPKLPEIPSLPTLPTLGLPIPPLILFEFLLGLFELPFKLLLKLFVPPDIKLIIDLPKLPELVFKMAFEIVLQLMIDLNLLLITPKTLIAAILVYLKNVVGMVVTVLIGSIVGAGGVAKSGAQLCGLV